MSLPDSNGTIGTLRTPAMNPATKQTGAPAANLANVPAYIRDAASDTRAGQLAAQYDLAILVDISWDIVGGDQITGYNPSGQSPAPVLVVGHVQYHVDPDPTYDNLSYRKLWVKVRGAKSP